MATDDITDVSHSAAFLILESLEEKGYINAKKAAYFRSKYKELNEQVVKVYNNDNFLLRRARESRKILEGLRDRVDKCVDTAKTDDSEIQALKKEFSAAEHEAAFAQDRESLLQVEMHELDRRRKNLLHEIEDAVAAEVARLRPQIESLHEVIKSVGEKFEEETRNMEALKAERDELVRHEAELNDYNNSKSTLLINEAEDELQRIDKEPDRLRKQTELVMKSYLVTQKEIAQQKERIRLQLDAIEKKKLEKEELYTRLSELTLQGKQQESELNKKAATLQTLRANLDYEEENKRVCAKRVKELGALEQAASTAFNNERDLLRSLQVEKERIMKELRETEQATECVKSKIALDKEAILQMQREENRITNGQHAAVAVEISNMKNSVKKLNHEYLAQQLAEGQAIDENEAVIADIKVLEEEIFEEANKERLQRSEYADMKVHKEQVAQECARLKSAVQDARNEVQMKVGILAKTRRQREIASKRMQQLVELYSQVRQERSQKVAEIQAATQKLSEMQEKKSILERELEVLRGESLSRDQDMDKKNREMHLLRQTYRTLTQNLNIKRQKLEETQKLELELKTKMHSLNSLMIRAEEEMLDLKKQYEEVVESRNYAGIKLIDRNDELCILYEKANVQESILKQSALTLNQREETLKALSVRLLDLQRQIELHQRNMPLVKALEDELADILREYEDEKLREEVLENDITDPHNVARWRDVSSVIPDNAQLEECILELQEKLTRMNEKLMEKDLLYEEVSEMNKKMRRQALCNRDATLGLVKCLGASQSGIKIKTKKMMAAVSELSLFQASSVQLAEEVQQLEKTVTEAKERLSQGEPPTEYHRIKLQREENDRARWNEYIRSRRENSKSQEQLTRTKAQFRPNAYIPLDEDDLAVPKPFGSHAPFKPNDDAKRQATRYFRNNVEAV